MTSKLDDIESLSFFFVLFFLGFFWHCCFPLVKFKYWAKFHVNIITSFGVMTVFIYRGLNKYLKRLTENIYIWRLGQVGDIKFDMNVSNEKLQNIAKCQGHNFYCFRVIMGKLIGGVIPPNPDQV